MPEIIYPNFAETFIRAQQAKNAMLEQQMAPVRFQNELVSQRINELKLQEAQKELEKKGLVNNVYKKYSSPGAPAQTLQPERTSNAFADSYRGMTQPVPSYNNEMVNIPARQPSFDARGAAGELYGVAPEEAMALEDRAAKIDATKADQEAKVFTRTKDMISIIKDLGRDKFKALQPILANLDPNFKLIDAEQLSISQNGEVAFPVLTADGKPTGKGVIYDSEGKKQIIDIGGTSSLPYKLGERQKFTGKDGAEYEGTFKGLDANGEPRFENIRKVIKSSDGLAEERLKIAQERLTLEKERTEAAKQKGKRLPTKDVNDLNDLQGSVERLGSLGKAFKDDFGGKVVLGGWNTKLKDVAGMDTAQVNWWKDYKELDAIRRNAIFGASLTGNEKSSWDAITVNERSDPATIKQAVVNRMRILSEAYNRKIENYKKGGYDVEEFSAMSVPESTGFSNPAPASGGSGEFKVGPYKVRVK